MTRIALRVLVTGRVQGVAFRWHTKEEADALGVAGSVRNLDDGRVEVVVEGPEDDVEVLCSWLEDGPPAASVSGLDCEPVRPTGGRGFEILR